MKQLRFDRVVTGEQAGEFIFTRVVAQPDYKAKVKGYTLALLHKLTRPTLSEPRIKNQEARMFSRDIPTSPSFSLWHACEKWTGKFSSDN